MEDSRAEVRDLTGTDPDFLRMSDADMERQIAEIKKALTKQEPGKK
jgi:hypothetical protein